MPSALSAGCTRYERSTGTPRICLNQAAGREAAAAEAAAVAAPEVEAERLRAYAGCRMERPLCDACSVVWSLVLSTSRLFQASCRTIRVPTNRRLRMIRHEAWLGARRCMPRARAQRRRRRRGPSGCRRALLEIEGWKVRNTSPLDITASTSRIRTVPHSLPHSYRPRLIGTSRRFSPDLAATCNRSWNHVRPAT